MKTSIGLGGLPILSARSALSVVNDWKAERFLYIITYVRCVLNLPLAKPAQPVPQFNILYLLNTETTSPARLAGICLRKASRVAHGRNSEAAPIDLALRRREAASKGAP
jgi:hypothetical protein